MQHDCKRRLECLGPREKTEVAGYQGLLGCYCLTVYGLVFRDGVALLRLAMVRAQC